MATSKDSSLLNILDDRLHIPVENGISHSHPRRKPSHDITRASKRTHKKIFSKRKRNRSLLRRTWTLPFGLVLIVLLLYMISPTESNIFHHFLFLSYRLEDDVSTMQYGKGPWDFAFVCFYTVVLTFAREFLMQEILRPLARFCGIKSRSKQSRFLEQMYVVVYVAFMGPFGLYCMKQTPVWYFNTRGMYEFFPHRTHDAELKFYYLFQAAFWSQQALVMLLGMEEKRKDYQELVAHHFVTIALIGLSYRFHFTYMGIAVYISHDISDFFLAMSKSLNYIGSPLQGPSFGFCIVMWTYLRHYINLRILYSILTEFSTVGPYGIDWETQQYKGLISQTITFVLLAALQLLNLFWLYCLLRNAYRFIFLGIAKDDRSEDEEPEHDTKEPRIENNDKIGEMSSSKSTETHGLAVKRRGTAKKHSAL
ncbi:longevity assurance proteins LAG1/LAC1 [Annulohypoxylon maeteangense]|uniref:longevity assurance proteins LAG1/LAC1 n=1 Tax=Annulohypoxylon maeteangense TaxID=1927788 RepID=UPI002007B0DB|nr:longevity assurance proteins LAG1/LAC1 [Annulohypoxylon maeteangense]KAI0888584.1 longevity assurance proteins LAG1/LAC1 [Annulohypoxylon maeteangense]